MRIEVHQRLDRAISAAAIAPPDDQVGSDEVALHDHNLEAINLHLLLNDVRQIFENSSSAVGTGTRTKIASKWITWPMPSGARKVCDRTMRSITNHPSTRPSP